MSDAVALLETADETARATGDRIASAYALHDLVRLGFALNARDRLNDLADTFDGDLVPACAAHGRALSVHDADALVAVAERFAELGADLYAAETAAQAAAVLRRAGSARQAASVGRRVAELSARCEGAQTPALAQGTLLVALSACEREVALLAAGGRSNREIADTLRTSVRTVEHQLQRAYEKLGVSGRSALSEALGSARPA